MSLFNAYMRLSGSVNVVVSQDEKINFHMPFTLRNTSANTCDLYIVVNDYNALMTTIDILESEDIPWLVIGKGTSFLPVEMPYHGALIELGKEFKKIEFDVETGCVYAGAACKLNHVVMACASEGVENLECFGGIPGTVGGAVVLNVACDLTGKYRTMHDESAKSEEDSLYLADRDCHCIRTPHHIIESIASIVIYNPKAHGLERIPCYEIYNDDLYTGGTLPLPHGAVILEVCFDTSYVDSYEDRMTAVAIKGRKRPARYSDSVAARTDTQIRHAVSIQPNPMYKGIYPFRTSVPVPHKTIGNLLSTCFEEGIELGDAMLDEKYPEYIINTKNHYADDVYDCMKLIQRKAKEVYGIELEPKVTLLGVSSKTL